MTIGFAVQSDMAAPNEWFDLARRVEAAGYEALCVADHPGSTAAPYVALAAASSVTTTIALGTAVLNAGAWHPLDLAAELATLDRLSGGRALFGIGAGHTPAEWTMRGRALPDVASRVANLDAVIDAVERLLAGETVTAQGDGWVLEEASLRDPRPVQDRIPLLVGGNGRGTLRCGARRAATVEVTGLGATLPDGHLHVPAWAPHELDERITCIEAAVPAGRTPPRLGVLVQHVELTDDRVRAAADFQRRLADLLPADAAPSVDDLLATPFVLVGTEAEMLGQLEEHRRRWGITRYTVRTGAVDALAPIVAGLRSV